LALYVYPSEHHAAIRSGWPGGRRIGHRSQPSSRPAATA